MEIIIGDDTLAWRWGGENHEAVQMSSQCDTDGWTLNGASYNDRLSYFLPIGHLGLILNEGDEASEHKTMEWICAAVFQKLFKVF